MAEEKTESATPEENPPAPKKSKKMLWIVIGAVVLAGGGAGGFFALKDGEPPAAAAEATPAKAVETSGLVGLDTFLVNLNDPGASHYLKLTLRLTVSPEAEADKLNQDELLMARVRDRILTVLTMKTYSDLLSPLGKEALRHEIQAQLGPILDTGSVQDVLFSEFVVQ